MLFCKSMFLSRAFYYVFYWTNIIGRTVLFIIVRKKILISKNNEVAQYIFIHNRIVDNWSKIWLIVSSKNKIKLFESIEVNTDSLRKK